MTDGAAVDAASVEEALRVGVALHRAGDLERAGEVYAGILQVCADQPEALQFSGILEFQRGNHELGLERLGRAVELRPDHAGMWSNLGNMLKMQGGLDRAEEAYRRAIELAPDLADAHCNLGVVRRSRGDKAGAVEAFERALDLDPTHVETLHNLGNLFTSTRQWDGAVDCYQRVIAADADLKTRNLSAEGLIRALASSGRRGEIESVLRRWRGWDPHNPVAAHLLAAHTARDVPARASDDYLRSLFDTFAGSFDSVLHDLEYRAPELVMGIVQSRVLPTMTSPRVLDAGCGTGLAGVLLAPYAGRLVGVDISPAMLERASARAVYDELVTGEMTSFLNESPRSFDLVTAVDALVYFGDLEDVLQACAGALVAGGWLVFTIERHGGTAPFRLDISGRYQHSAAYVHGVLAGAGFTDVQAQEVLLRLEGGQGVQGLLVCARLGGVGGEAP